ncbi:MAG: haloacid dehalogenase type II [Planctomycetota bacterium]|nr:haloacid dehalogenase type II [Planctomycetota bacterium]
MGELINVSALVFDAYGTLFDVHSVSAALEARFPGRGAELSERWRVRQLQYTWLRSLMGRYQDFWRVTGDALETACASLHLRLEPRARDELMQAYLELAPFADVPGALLQLSGYRRAILSNGTPRMLAAVVQRAGLDKDFDAILSVDEVGIFKPHPQAYELAPRHLKASKEEILFVSSNHWDIQGAKAYGFRAAWLNRGGAPAEALGERHNLEVSTLAELAERLKS